jgi:hypothetical protein
MELSLELSISHPPSPTMKPSSIYTLLSIDTNILVEILEFSGGMEISRFWISGNRLLQSKLSSACGIRHFIISRPLLSEKVSYIPLIRLFHNLQVLRIEILEHICSLPNLSTNEISLLPPGLVEISFRFSEAEECFMRPFHRRDKEDFDNSKKRVHFDFAKKFPSIHTLKLVSVTIRQLLLDLNMSSLGTIYGKLQDSDLKLFPHSLTRLELPENDNLTYNGISCLPSSIEILNLDRSSISSNKTMKGFSLLPIRVLTINRLLKAGENDLNGLPTTLTHLELSGCSELIGNGLKYLSSNLIYLDLSNLQQFEGDFFEYLPPQLEHLSLGKFSISKPSYLTNLPSKLTFLDVSSLFDLKGGDIIHLPRNLISLFIGSISQPIVIEEIQNLPPKMTFLKVGSETFTNDSVFALPPCITIFEQSGHPNLTIECIPNLPKSLTKLQASPMGLFRPPKNNPAYAVLRNEMMSPSARYKNGWLSIPDAVEFGHLEILKWLIVREKFSIRIKQKETIIHLAALNGHVHILRWLKSIGWTNQFNGTNEDALTIAHIAAQYGQIEVLKFWSFELKADLSQQENRLYRMIVHSASMNGQLETLKWIHEQGKPKMDAKDRNHWTPSHFAAANGHLNILQWLQSIDIKLNQHTVAGMTPLELAKSKKQKEVFDWLKQQTDQ